MYRACRLSVLRNVRQAQVGGKWHAAESRVRLCLCVCVCLKAQTDECRVWLIRSIVCGWRALKNVGQVDTLRLELLGSVGLWVERAGFTRA